MPRFCNGFTARILTFEPQVFRILKEPESSPSLTLLGAYRGADRWTCARGLIRIQLSVLPVPFKWTVSETRRRWYQGRFCWSGTYQPGGLSLISLGFGQGGRLPRRTLALVVEWGKPPISQATLQKALHARPHLGTLHRELSRRNFGASKARNEPPNPCANYLIERPLPLILFPTIGPTQVAN